MSESPLNVAMPLAWVFTVRVPPRVPLPVPTAAVTATPAWLTALPEESCTRTAGCSGKATPLTTCVEGCWLMASRAAAPGPRTITSEVSGTSPAAVNAMV